MQIWQTVFDTPIGPMRALSSLNGLCWLAFQEEGEFLNTIPSRIAPYFPNAQLEQAPSSLLHSVEHWVNLYFQRQPLPNLPALDLQGTDFSKKLWTALLSVSMAEVKTYGWLAMILANPKAVRAVGRSLRENPIALMVPCHRIIGANGSLTGYRGGLWRKEWLLNHEQTMPPPGLATKKSAVK